jgi:hypothetical protein
MVLNACIALLPVLLFLAALVLMDTFKLAHWTTIVEGMLWGVAAALICDWAYDAIFRTGWFSEAALSRYVAPAVEETTKAAFIVHALCARGRTSLDTAVVGFAVGCGFALGRTSRSWRRSERNAGPVAGAWLRDRDPARRDDVDLRDAGEDGDRSPGHAARPRVPARLDARDRAALGIQPPVAAAARDDRAAARRAAAARSRGVPAQ